MIAFFVFVLWILFGMLGCIVLIQFGYVKFDKYDPKVDVMFLSLISLFGPLLLSFVVISVILEFFISYINME